MRHILLIALSFLVAGCSQQVLDAFDLPMYEYDAKYGTGTAHWTPEDIHVYVNRMKLKPPTDRYPDVNGNCLVVAEEKYRLAKENGYDPFILVVKLHEWTDGSTHAMLVVGRTVYDNGFISETPFDIDEIERYGVVIADQWSRYR